MSRERKLLNNVEQGNDKLTEIIYLSLLYDFYGELLGEHKKQIFEDYVLNDLSLSEVADETGISRQGVYDIIKRCTAKLKEYEEKLHLVQKFEQTKRKVNQIKQISMQMKEEKILPKISEITEASYKTAEISDKIIEISDKFTEISDKIIEISDKFTEISDKVIEASDKIIEISDEILKEL